LRRSLVVLTAVVVIGCWAGFAVGHEQAGRIEALFGSDITVAAFVSQVTPEFLPMLFADVRDKPARNERIHRAMRIHEYTLKELSNYLGLHYSTISVIAKHIDEESKHQK
jgi:hypothetical protein